MELNFVFLLNFIFRSWFLIRGFFWELRFLDCFCFFIFGLFRCRGILGRVFWEELGWIFFFFLIRLEFYVISLLKMYVRRFYSCYEFFGFDIMLDENFKFWVLEVNIFSRWVVFLGYFEENFFWVFMSLFLC